MLRLTACWLIGLSFLTASLAPAPGLAQDKKDRPAPAGPSLRVLTYNIFSAQGKRDKIVERQGKKVKVADDESSKADLQRVAEMIKKFQPDLVALQEVEVNTETSGGVGQARELGNLTGLHAVFGKARAADKGQFGVAILSKVKLFPPEVRPLPPAGKASEAKLPAPAPSPLKGEEKDAGKKPTPSPSPGASPAPGMPEPRVALIVGVRPSNDLPHLTFISTHMTSAGEADSANLRLEQAKMFNRTFGGDKGPPVILAATSTWSPATRRTRNSRRRGTCIRPRTGSISSWSARPTPGASWKRGSATSPPPTMPPS
jgi:hypothetical protein